MSEAGYSDFLSFLSALVTVMLLLVVLRQQAAIERLEKRARNIDYIRNDAGVLFDTQVPLAQIQAQLERNGLDYRFGELTTTFIFISSDCNICMQNLEMYRDLALSIDSYEHRAYLCSVANNERIESVFANYRRLIFNLASSRILHRIFKGRIFPSVFVVDSKGFIIFVGHPSSYAKKIQRLEQFGF